MGDLRVVAEQKPTLIDMATEILTFLNSKCGRKYPARNPRGEPTANSQVVIHRLKEGYTVSDCRAVIAAKCRQWSHDEKMSKFLTPETLFRRSNFERYMGELEE
jgi:uncharacterized phage protein (TIGR02220 family)